MRTLRASVVWHIGIVLGCLGVDGEHGFVAPGSGCFSGRRSAMRVVKERVNDA